MAPSTVDARINQVASRTCSVVHARDLRHAGVTRDAVKRRIASGSMAVVLPRTYAVGPQSASPTFDMRCMAAALAGGEGTRIDGPSAGALLGVWDRADERVYATVPGRCHGGAPPSFAFHRADPTWCPVNPLNVGAIPLVGFVDMCLRMATSLTKWQLAFVVRRGIYERLVRLHDFDAGIAGWSGRPGIPVLRAALELVRSGSAGTRSISEDLLLEDVLGAGATEPDVNVRGVLGLSRDEPDFVWRDRRLNVEVDGRQHDDPSQARDDDRRDIEAEALGFRVIRVRVRDVWRSRPEVVRSLMTALAGGSVETDRRRYLRIR